MLYRNISICIFFALSLSLSSNVAHSQFDNWLDDAFVKPVPGPVAPGENPKPQTTQQTMAALKEFVRGGTFLSNADVNNFSKSLEGLVGNYFYMDKDNNNVIQLAGKTVENSNNKIDIKDGVVFKAVVDRKFNAGVKFLPFLSANMDNRDLLELTIRNIASVHGNADTNLVNCNYPIGYMGQPDIKMNYITAATVSVVHKKIYKLQKQGGSLIYSIFKLDGKNYYSNELVQSVPVISISYIRAVEVPPQYAHLCKKYNEATRAVMAGVMKKSDDPFVQIARVLDGAVRRQVPTALPMQKNLRGRIISIKADDGRRP